MTGRLLIFGSGGQLGSELRERAAATGWTVTALDRANGDLTDADAVSDAVGNGANIVINAAAYTAVDRAESEPDLAYAVNRDGPANLAEACRATKTPLIHVSTDYVYDGRKEGPWREDDPVNPVSVYGSSKLAGEQAIRQALPQHVIIRTSWVYGAHGHNFVKTMLRLGAERDELRVVDDQLGCPTSAADLAQACLTTARQVISGQPRWGSFHYCGAGRTSWYGFADRIFSLAESYGRKRPRLLPITTAEYPTPARRPANSVLDCAKIERDYQVVRPDWQESLAAVVGQLCNR